MAQDYYKILGVDKKASQDEIKTQYRKLARQYHPDLHPNDANAAAKFKEINEANEVLSDPQKRAQYDYEQENPFASQGAGGFSGFSGGFEDIFDIFGGFGGFGGSNAKRQTSTKGIDRTIEVDISFLDAVKGCTKEISYSRKEPCSACKGTGAKNGTSYKTCEKCHGSGQVQYVSGSSIFRTVSVKPCPDCNGTGKKVIDKCTNCSGKGYNRVTTKIKLDIPAGADNKSYIKKLNMGDASTNGGEPGDLYVIFNVQPHPIFIRKKYDLYVDLPISYKTAALGGKVSVPWIDDTFLLDIPEGTQNGKVFLVKGKGIKSRFGSGNMYVTIFVEVPTKLTRSQKQKLEDFDDEVEIKQSEKMQKYKTNLQSLYNVNPYK